MSQRNESARRPGRAPSTASNASDTLFPMDAAVKAGRDDPAMDHERTQGAAMPGWPGGDVPPIPLETGALPPWPRGLLPEAIEALVAHVADFNSVPFDLPALSALGLLSASLAGKVIVSPFEGHAEPLMLYCLSACPTGQRKTSTFRHLTSALYDYQRACIEEWKVTRAKYDADCNRLRAEIKALSGQGKNLGDDDDNGEYADHADRIRRAQVKLDTLKPPPDPHFLMAEPTPEGLAKQMADSGGYSVIVAPEGGGLIDIIAGKYSDAGPTLSLLCQSYDGEPFSAPRAAADRTIRAIDSPTLVIISTLQPEVLPKLRMHDAIKDRGWLGRCLYVIPGQNLVGTRPASKPAIPAAVKERFEKVVSTLLRIERPQAPHVLRLDASACAAYADFHNRIEPQLAPGAPLADLCGWGHKHVGRINRIAGLLHCAEHYESTAPWGLLLTRQTYQRAVALSDYFVAHAQAALHAMALDPDAARAKRALEWIKKGARTRFTTGELHREVFKHDRVGEVRKVVALLADHLYIAAIPSTRRDSQVWMVNPWWQRCSNG